MLIDSAIGDAYGAGFEYVDDKIVDEFGTLLLYRSHPKHKQIKPGMYTDDTQMSLAIAEAMLENDPWTTESLSERFVSVFKRDPRTGYSRRLYSTLEASANGTDFLARLNRDSDRSGAAMRAYHIGLYPSIDEVIYKSRLQASITHNSPLGVIASQASSLVLHYFAYTLGEKKGLGDFIDDLCASNNKIGKWNEPYDTKVGEKGWMSVKAAITAISRGESMTEILKDCIAFTGDVDTVATIALGAASLSKEVEQNLPQHLYDGLENGTYGSDYIIGLDRQLYQRFLDI